MPLWSENVTLDYYLQAQAVFVMSLYKMYEYKELFDLSNFPVSSKYYCSDNKKLLGKIKNEYGGKSILKFVGLKSKIYSILNKSNNEKITSKGHNGFNSS